MAKKQKKDHIPLIHNYCDRWCERCTLSSHCAIYEENMRNKDLSPEDFVKILSKNFKKAIKTLREAAKKHGIDIDQLPDYEAPQPNEEREQRVKALLKKTTSYYIKVNQWFKAKQDFFKEEENSLIARIEMEIPIDEAAILQLNDAIEVIRWYQHFINVKTYRAIHENTLLSSEDNEEETTLSHSDPLQSDENGSAKVALIAIERSIIAWESVRSYFPDFTDEILDIFLLLNEIRRELLVWQPHAYEFVRPGFDEGWQEKWAWATKM
jgi:hypothetical protein